MNPSPANGEGGLLNPNLGGGGHFSVNNIDIISYSLGNAAADSADL